MAQLLNMFQKCCDVLKMDSNSFYPMLITIFLAIVPFLKGWYRKIKDNKEKRMFELYCKKESDNFYAKIMLVELMISCLSIITISVSVNLIANLFLEEKYLIWKHKFTIIISSVVSIVVLLKVIKIKWIRERLLGDKIGKVIILCSILSINIGIMCLMLDEKVMYVGSIFILLYYFDELAGVFYFQGRYIKYDFSSIKLYLDGESILCENIEKIKRRKNYIIVEKEDKSIVLRYDKIYRVEYYGPPKVILRENTFNFLAKYKKR